MKRIIGTLLIILLVMSQISGCGANSKSAQDEGEALDYSSSYSTSNNGGTQKEEAVANEAYDDASSARETEDYFKVTGIPNDVNNKIIYRGQISLETEEFDETISKIEKTIAESNAYIQNSSIRGRGYDEGDPRHAHFEIRVPKERFDYFKKDAENWGNVNHASQTTEDVTEYYYDTEARLETLEIQEERLLELLKKAEKIEDILALERELQSIRYNIESHTGSLRKMDNLIDYSTLSVEVYEVKEVTVIPKSFGHKMTETIRASAKSFQELLKNIIIVGIYILPYFIILAILFILLKKKKLKIPKIKFLNKKDNE